MRLGMPNRSRLRKIQFRSVAYASFASFSFSSERRHTRYWRDWSSDVCSSDLKVALAFVSFCLVSSATYLLNDVRDLESDRLHPTKRHRPIAAGLVSIPFALGAGVVLLAAGLDRKRSCRERV